MRNSVNNCRLAAHGDGGIALLLQHLNNAFAQCKPCLCVCIQIASELSKSLKFAILGIEQFQLAGNLFHGFELSRAADTADRNAGVDCGANT